MILYRSIFEALLGQHTRWSYVVEVVLLVLVAAFIVFVIAVIGGQGGEAPAN